MKLDKIEATFDKENLNYSFEVSANLLCDAELKEEVLIFREQNYAEPETYLRRNHLKIKKGKNYIEGCIKIS